MERNRTWRLPVLALSIVALAALASCTVTFDWSTNSPYAVVTDEAGAAVAGVSVTLTGSGGTFTATTNASGEATFTTFTSSDIGTYDLTASAAGYVFYTTTVTVGQNSVYLGTLIAYVPAVTTSTITGVARDARLDTAAEITGATVSLFAEGGTTALATFDTGTDGVFTFTQVAPGKYRISAALTGYAFIDKSFELTQVDTTVDTGELLGFSSASNEISFIVVWSPAFSDVDSHFTIPGSDLYVSGATPAFADPYAVSGLTNGFEPTTTTGREDIYYSNKTSTATVGDFMLNSDTTPAVTLDVDVTTGSGPETITIHSLPIPALNTDYPVIGDPATNGLATDAINNYAWVGVSEYYLHAFGTPTLSTEGAAGGAAAEVYVVQGADVKGRFVIPDYMTIDMASVVRVNMFLRQDGVPVYQFVPDVRIADYTGIRSAAGAAAPLVLYGSARN